MSRREGFSKIPDHSGTTKAETFPEERREHVVFRKKGIWVRMPNEWLENWKGGMRFEIGHGNEIVITKTEGVCVNMRHSGLKLFVHVPEEFRQIVESMVRPNRQKRVSCKAVYNEKKEIIELRILPDISAKKF